MVPGNARTFGDMLKHYRMRAGLTQEELAERAQLSARGISDLERGARRTPRQDTMLLLVKALQLSGGDRSRFEAAARGHDQAIPPTIFLGTQLNNLPTPSTPLVGRTQEVQTVCSILRRSEVRLLSLTGPGGVGKTRVAMQVASVLHNELDDGAFFVALAPISDPTLVTSTIARTLDIKDVGSLPLFDSVTAYLRNKNVLLVLDNFEHVVEAAPHVTELLTACPYLRILVTSRAALQVSHEHLFPVSPLSLPNLQHLPKTDQLVQYDAIRLFLERAQAVRSDFVITDTNTIAVAEICTRLDGLPLAIELAAARSRILPPQALLLRLNNRLKLLTRSASDLPARQQTLRATIDWSYNLLQQNEQRLFARLGVFIGGCTLEAVEEVCNVEGDLEVLDDMDSLVEKSLLRQDNVEGEPRFTMLETIREYALERLEQQGETEGLRKRYSIWVLRLAERAEPNLRNSQQTAWFEQLEAEHDNIRAVLAWSHETAGDSETGLRLVGAIWRFWFVRGYFSECRRWLEGALARGSATATDLRAKALFGAAMLARYQGEYPRAAALAQEGVACARAAGDEWLTAATLVILGTTYYEQDAGDQGLELLEESLGIAQKVGDHWLIAWTLHTLGWRVKDRGDYRRAAVLLKEAVMLARSVGDQWLIAWTLHTLGWSELYQSGYRQAAALLEESLAIREALGDKPGSAWALASMGKVAAAQGDYDAARSLHQRRLTLEREMGNVSGIAGSFWSLGDVVFAEGDIAQALSLHTEGLARSRELADNRFIARSLRSLGDVVLVQGDDEHALALQTEALTLSRELRDTSFIARSLRSLGDVALAQGDFTAANTYYRESLTIFNSLANRQDLPACIEGLARVAMAQGLTIHAAHVCGAAAAFRAANHVPLSPIERPRFEQMLGSVQAQLTDTTFMTAWTAGQTISPAQIIADAASTDGGSAEMLSSMMPISAQSDSQDLPELSQIAIPKQSRDQ
jgi:predicted ATPase/transcriptional regulator with XRE-family HTH domain